MNPELLLAIVPILMVVGIFAYTTIRWRRAPAAIKAINYAAISGLVVGILSGALATHALERWSYSERLDGGKEPAPSVASQPAKIDPLDGIPAADVCRALGEQEMKHLTDPKWHSLISVAQDCRLGLNDPLSLQCEAASIYEDPHRLHGEWKEHTDIVPYGVVAQFCDAGFADKDSKVCVAAYRFGSKSG